MCSSDLWPELLTAGKLISQREHPESLLAKGRKPNWPGATSTAFNLSKPSRALLDSRRWEGAKINLQKSMWVAKIVAFIFGK